MKTNKLKGLSTGQLRKKEKNNISISIFNLIAALIALGIVFIDNLFYVDSVDYISILRTPMFLIGFANLLFTYSGYRNYKQIKTELTLR